MKFETTKNPTYFSAFQPRAEVGAAYSFRTPTRTGSIRLLFNSMLAKYNRTVKMIGNKSPNKWSVETPRRELLTNIIED